MVDYLVISCGHRQNDPQDLAAVGKALHQVLVVIIQGRKNKLEFVERRRLNILAAGEIVYFIES